MLTNPQPHLPAARTWLCGATDLGYQCTLLNDTHEFHKAQGADGSTLHLWARSASVQRRRQAEKESCA